MHELARSGFGPVATIGRESPQSEEWRHLVLVIEERFERKHGSVETNVHLSIAEERRFVIGLGCHVERLRKEKCHFSGATSEAPRSGQSLWVVSDLDLQ